MGAIADTQSALSSGGSSTNLLQIKVFPRNHTGDVNGLINTTISNNITLPGKRSNGSSVALGDPDGYPPELYPNITYVTTNRTDPTDPSVNLTLANAFPDYHLNSSSALFLGPLQINSSLALVSVRILFIFKSCVLLDVFEECHGALNGRFLTTDLLLFRPIPVHTTFLISFTDMHDANHTDSSLYQ